MRAILSETSIHPAIRQTIENNHQDIVAEVQTAVVRDQVVVVGMKQNPFPKKARALLTGRGIPFTYLEYGSYLSSWRRRTALKMWTGWPTFPMIFIQGVLIGGAQDLAKLADSGELDQLLQAERAS